MIKPSKDVRVESGHRITVYVPANIIDALTLKLTDYKSNTTYYPKGRTLHECMENLKKFEKDPTSVSDKIYKGQYYFHELFVLLQNKIPIYKAEFLEVIYGMRGRTFEQDVQAEGIFSSKDGYDIVLFIKDDE